MSEQPHSPPLVILRQRILRNAKNPNEGSMHLGGATMVGAGVPARAAELRGVFDYGPVSGHGFKSLP
jgi:hypothetical protein